jgi:hypothetical protein
MQIKQTIDVAGDPRVVVSSPSLNLNRHLWIILTHQIAKLLCASRGSWEESLNSRVASIFASKLAMASATRRPGYNFTRSLTLRLPSIVIESFHKKTLACNFFVFVATPLPYFLWWYMRTHKKKYSDISNKLMQQNVSLQQVLVSRNKSSRKTITQMYRGSPRLHQQKKNTYNMNTISATRSGWIFRYPRPIMDFD